MSSYWEERIGARLRFALCFALVLIAGPVIAQEGGKSESDLTAGLLDLVKPRKAEREGSERSDISKEAAAPHDAGQAELLLDELIPPETRRPAGVVQRVHVAMQAAASQLRGGQVESAKEVMQQQILHDLDALLATLAQQNRQARSQSTTRDQSGGADQQPGEQPASDQQDSRQDEQTQAADANSQSGQPSDNQSADGEKPEDDNQRSDGSGESNGTRAGQGEGPEQVSRSDIRDWQRAVWGQLPNQTRKQMQSRMVDRFLPSYQREIEAYFRVLMRELP